MGKVTPTRNEAGWFPVSTIASLIGVSPAGFRAGLMTVLPSEAVRRDRKPVLIFGPAVISAILRRETAALERRLESGADVPSPYLEEIRRWESKRRELIYRREADEVIAVSDVDRGFMMVAGILQRAGELIRSQFGPEASAILSNAWEDVRRRIVEMFSVEVGKDPEIGGNHANQIQS